MNFGILDRNRKEEVASLFTSVFSFAEGEHEGKLIGDLASALADSIDNQEIICIGAEDDGVIIGAIFFTRLRFDDPIECFLLAPVAVSTESQGSGVGQALINFGLRELKNRSALLAMTYGDPSYYSKVGFQPVSEDVIQAPVQLSMPEGWLGQSLFAETIPTLKGLPVVTELLHSVRSVQLSDLLIANG